MKILKLLLVLVLIFPAFAMADEVRLAWDANNPAPEGYRIFVRETAGDYDYSAPAWQGPGTTGEVKDLAAGTVYAFVVRAYVGDRESADSNEIIYTMPTVKEVIIYPGQPAMIRVIQ